MATTMTLAQLRTAVRQRADMVNSSFVTDQELNSYINQSYFELYDLLVTADEDYYVAAPVVFQTDGSQLYDLPNGTNFSGAPAFYKLKGVDLGLSNSTNAWVTIKRFEFISRNRYVYPQLNTTYLGVFNLRYKLLGNQIMFIPAPSGGQFVRLWYIPRLQTLNTDNSTVDGISGWTEYIIVDAAIKCLQKEESAQDVSILGAQKMLLIKRIEETAVNRDTGQPASISDTRTRSEQWGIYGPPNSDGSYGGY